MQSFFIFLLATCAVHVYADQPSENPDAGQEIQENSPLSGKELLDAIDGIWSTGKESTITYPEGTPWGQGSFPMDWNTVRFELTRTLKVMDPNFEKVYPDYLPYYGDITLMFRAHDLAMGQIINLFPGYHESDYSSQILGWRLL